MRVSLIFLVLIVPNGATADDVGQLVGVLREVRERGPVEARTAWDELVRRDARALPAILAGMNTEDVVAVNWLRSAFDRIAERELAKKAIAPEPLLAFVRDAKNHGRPRRLALELVERIRPDTKARLLKGMLDDREFRYDAVARALAGLEKDAPKKERVTRLRQLFSACRDFDQARAIASELRELGVSVSVADHLGFLRDWYVVGPFDGHEMTSFTRAYPPEKKVDLGASYVGKGGKKLTWRRFQVEEMTSGRHAALVNLRTPLGDAPDSVAYAFAKIRVDSAREVDFRGAGDDHFTVWVNGERAFGFEEYRNGVRFDRHRFRAKLRKGDNAILVKIAQAPLDEVYTALNWEFLLRVCDSTGKGVEFSSTYPKD